MLKHGAKAWRSTQTAHYDCRFDQTYTVHYMQLTITEYPAMLEGDDPRVQQKLTITDCYYRAHYCAPKESPDTKIVWHNVKHDSTIYHEMGIFPVKQIDNYFLIPNLGIGGSSIEEDENAYLLDTGYQIIKKNKGTYHVPKGFANY